MFLLMKTTTAAAKARKNLERLAWKYTHRDYKGVINGSKYVMHNGTNFVYLDTLTDAELMAKLPADVRAVLYSEAMAAEVLGGKK